MKSFLLRLLPASLERRLRLLHHYRVVRDFVELSEPDLPMVRRLVKPGDRVIDIGANIGIYTRFLAEAVGESGSVYSVEPIPLTFEILQNNVIKLGLSNVSLFPVAVSDREGTVTMVLPDSASGVANLYRAKIQNGESQGRPFSINATTLDRLFAESEHPIAFVKIDVEGVELAVLRGAEQLLRKFRPILLVEINENPDDPKTESGELFALLQSHGYRPFRFNGSELVPRSRGDTSVNYFFLTESPK